METTTTTRRVQRALMVDPELIRQVRIAAGYADTTMPVMLDRVLRAGLEVVNRNRKPAA